MDFILAPWQLSFTEDIACCANNVQVAANLRDVFPHPYTREDAADYIEMCMQNDMRGQLCRAIVADGHAIGSIGVFIGTDVYQKSGELGYWLAEPCWGQGIMTAAVRDICTQAFALFALARIYAEPFATNAGSCRVLEKAGFILEGVKRNSVFKNNVLLDSKIYALLKETT